MLSLKKSFADMADIEKRSSAVTLSDMEIFVFPELIYSLVLANIMSPRIWKWLDDPWFDGIEKMKPYRRITRLKQYIMDHYVFNLDLDTWGLTSKEKEIARFSSFVSPDVLAQSNALFGYEGDKYYFDIDIRTHFGLDKYEGNIIPYWKTETVEAMDAFRYRPGYITGAGECVSLSTLYAAALFVIARIPLKDIFLMATPLHSQNFIDMDDGILTNNRRLVTKTMWFNGSELSAQARRALENEKITVVAHETGWIHTIYDEATIDPAAFSRFSEKLSGFLKTGFSGSIMGNFLRHKSKLQKCFQFRWCVNGIEHYIGAERIFAYEHGSSYQFTDNTRDKLMSEIEMEEFRMARFPERIIINDLEDFISKNNIDLDKEQDMNALMQQFCSDCLEKKGMISELKAFIHVRPRIPSTDRKFSRMSEPLGINVEMGRQGIIDRLKTIRGSNAFADLAFDAYRDISTVDPAPFLLAAVQRNPVCVRGAEGFDYKAITAKLESMPADSVYDDPERLAQPDEVWNFGRGDGLEKLIMLAAIIRSREDTKVVQIKVEGVNAVLTAGDLKVSLPTVKKVGNVDWVLD